ncbi:hypothetical protein WR25_14307 [Diploscapter pachys]|uniref:Uncharacterized protein n=1 Tax=Diploscapter pachys TaxID=2018661 RepID=A0A2A2KGR0_9BILA|nr:hypothetical protein WR25_14307 [Diploscapter pachys]
MAEAPMSLFRPLLFHTKRSHRYDDGCHHYHRHVTKLELRYSKNYDDNRSYDNDNRSYDDDNRTYDDDNRSYDNDNRSYDNDNRSDDDDNRSYDDDNRTYDNDGFNGYNF